MTISNLKVFIIAYNARYYCFIFLLKNERDVKRVKLNFDLKSIVVTNVVVLPNKIECWCQFIYRIN